MAFIVTGVSVSNSDYAISRKDLEDAVRELKNVSSQRCGTAEGAKTYMYFVSFINTNLMSSRSRATAYVVCLREKGRTTPDGRFTTSDNGSQRSAEKLLE